MPLIKDSSSGPGVLVRMILTEMVAGSGVVMLLEGCVQTGVYSNLKTRED